MWLMAGCRRWARWRCRCRLSQALVRVARGREADSRWRYLAIKPEGGSNRRPRDTCLIPGDSQMPRLARPAVASGGMLLGAPGEPASWIEFVREGLR